MMVRCLDGMEHEKTAGGLKQVPGGFADRGYSSFGKARRHNGSATASIPAQHSARTI